MIPEGARVMAPEGPLILHLEGVVEVGGVGEVEKI